MELTAQGAPAKEHKEYEMASTVSNDIFSNTGNMVAGWT